MSNFIWYTGILLLSLVLWRVWQPTLEPDQTPRREVATETGTASDRCTPQGVPYSTLPHMVNADGQYLFCRTWEPALEPGQKPRALVFLNHGLGSHSGCIGPILAEMLNPHGFLIFAHDHIGDGQSEGERMLVESLDSLTRDILQHVDLMAAKYPGVPIFSLGNSLGGSLSITAAVERPGLFSGIILIGPGIEQAQEWHKSYFMWSLLWLGSKIIPNWEVPEGSHELTSYSPSVEKLDEDPLRHQTPMTIRLGMKLLYAMLPLQDLFLKMECPFLMMYGEDDNDYDVSKSWKLFDQAKSKDKEMKTYPNCRHVLLMEDPKYLPKIKEDIVNWLLARVDPEKESA